MHRISIPDPFNPGSFFSIDPEAMIEKCKAIWERHEKDHALCPHCQRLRDRVSVEVENLALLSTLGENTTEVEAAIVFSEMAKPWGPPLAGPTDTQPYRAINPNDPPPVDTLPPALDGVSKEELELAADGAAQEEIGFEVVK